MTWDRSFIRRCIFEDAYRPHAYEEVAAVVATDVAARLDPEKRYGLWWFNRKGTRVRQVSEPSKEGRRYKKKYTQFAKPKEEWIAVPVPNAGVPRAVVERAREAAKQNKAPSRAANEFWELSGGLIRCGHCGKRMTPVPKTKTYKDKRYVYRYYRCSRNRSLGSGACLNKKHFNARKLDALTSRQEQIAELERSVDELMAEYASITPEALTVTSREERHQLYRMLGIKVFAWPDGRLAVELGRLSSVSKESLSS